MFDVQHFCEARDNHRESLEWDLLLETLLSDFDDYRKRFDPERLASQGGMFGTIPLRDDVFSAWKIGASLTHVGQAGI
ncbi:MAG TPA: hypothetical protein VGN12_07820 [Pirellulales bacterium]|jgi:hypothetical protein